MFFIEKEFVNDKTNWWFVNESCCAALLRSSGMKILKHPRPGVYLCEPNKERHVNTVNASHIYLPRSW